MCSLLFWIFFVFLASGYFFIVSFIKNYYSIMSNKHLFLKSRILEAHLGNGIGRYVCQLKRVTLKFCKNHGSSRGMRDFIENDLIDYAKDNQGTVVYIKPRRHRSPVIVAEYLNQSKHWISCRQFSREEIIKWMELLRTQSHEGSATRLQKLNSTYFPSIQGPWTPFTFRDPALNITKFPSEEFGKSLKVKTATEQLIEKFKQQKLTETDQEKCSDRVKNTI